MRDDFRIQAYNTLKQEKTSGLIKIWKRNDHRKWSELDFEVIREILQERLGEIPPQDEPVYKHVKQDTDDKTGNMRKRRYILLAMSIVLMLLSIRYVMFLNARRHLVCDELKFGMSVDDVLRVLNQNGEFTMSNAQWGTGYIKLYIRFTDPRGQALYDAFTLNFLDYEYDGAHTGQGTDTGSHAEFICYRGQITPSGRVRPKP